MAQRKRLTDESHWKVASSEDANATTASPSEAAGPFDNLDDDLTPAHYGFDGSSNPTKLMRSPHMIDPTELGLDEAQELSTLPDGTEAHLRVFSVEKALTRTNNVPYYKIAFETPDYPMVKDIIHQLYIPSPDSRPKMRADNQAKWKQFQEAFGYVMDGPFDPCEAWVGLEGWALLSFRTSPEFGDQNGIKKFLISR